MATRPTPRAPPPGARRSKAKQARHGVTVDSRRDGQLLSWAGHGRIVRGPVPVIVIALLLAGCSQAPQPITMADVCEASACEATVTIEDAGPTTYPVRGVVVDETVVPVAGAKVLLLQGHDPLGEVKTDQNGAFTFKGLSDGFYRLQVNREGYAQAETQLDIQGEPERMIRMQILSIPPIMPIHTIVKWDGFVGASANIGGFSPIRGGTITLFGEQIDHSGRSFYDELMAPGINPSWIQPEVVWESNQAAGDMLSLRLAARAPNEISRQVGTATAGSPLVYSMDAEAIHTHGIGRATNVSMPKGIHTDLRAGSTNFASPSLAIQQPFTMYFNILYHITPPEGWMFVTDGELA